MQVNSKSFPLRTGSCHIYPDAIHIRSKGLPNYFRQLLFRAGFQRYLVLYILLTLGFIISLLIAVGIQNYFLGFFFGIAALFSLRMAWVNRRLSFAPIIEKKQIDQIQYHEAVPGERRAAFTIVFKAGRHTLQRKIVLSGRKGEMIAQSAYFMMKDTGLLTTE